MIDKIKMKVHREIQGEVKTATIIRDVDQWFAAIFIEEKQQIPISDKSVRVGLGITSAIALNNGDLIAYLCFPRKAEERFCRERKMTLLPAKLPKKVRRQSTAEQSDDFAHKIAYRLSREY
jgi:putative transposase